MSVSITFYTLWGVRLPVNDDLIDEFHEGDFTRRNLIEPIYQHDGPAFMMLGDVLASGDKYEQLLEEIDIDTLRAKEAAFRERFAEQYPNFVSLIENEVFRLHCFNTFN
jgi:hypothetical protein